MLSLANSLSPWETWIETAGWLSSAVLNTWDFLTGIVVPFSISFVITPPKVSIPKDSGVTSSNNTSLTSPLKTPAWTAAPAATTSSGFTPLFKSFPKNSLTTWFAFGNLVLPPTIIISSISPLLKFASFKATFICSKVSSINFSVIDSNLALVKDFTKWIGPAFPIEINGRLISVDSADDNSFLAFSAASFNLWSAILSFLTSKPFSALNSSANQSIILLSKSSPPKKAFPSVLKTSKVPSPISRTVTSNVPPPKS